MRYDGLLLYGRPNRGEPFVGEFTRLAPGWRRSTRAVGGYWMGSFPLTGALPDILEQWYNDYLGCTVREQTAGIVTWEGLVYEMRLTLGGVHYLRSLAPEWWATAVRAAYTAPTGGQVLTGWLANADAAAEYGRMEYILVLGGSNATGAVAEQTKRYNQKSWPRSWQVDELQAAASPEEEDGLSIICAGFWATLNWRYYATSLEAQASALLGTLVASSEWVTAGRIEANAMLVYVNCDTPQRIGDLCEQVISQADAAGNLWQGGVYAGKKLDYELAPTTATHLYAQGRLTDIAGGPVVPSLVKPGILVRNVEAPTAGQPAGASSLWDRPDLAYVEETEYSLEDGLVLRLASAGEGGGA